jgi:hypothetical protein
VRDNKTIRHILFTLIRSLRPLLAGFKWVREGPLLAAICHVSTNSCLDTACQIQSEQLYVTHQPRENPAFCQVVISFATFLALLRVLRVNASEFRIATTFLR